jgi:hypothetical protein
VSWAKLDDQFHGHRKAKKAWKAHPRALGLHLLAISYCAGHLTDGLVDCEFVEEKIPAGRERAAVVTALVDAGLWAVEGDDWRINDWLDYNPSRQEVLDRRRRDSERKAARRRTESPQSPSGHRADSNGRPSDPSRAGAFPDPTRPDPTPFPPGPPPTGGRKRDREKWENTALSWAESLGLDGRRESVLRAVAQAEPWKSNGSAAQDFERFVAQHFSRSIARRP